MLIECSDWWAFEILLLFAGLIGVNDQAAFVMIQYLAAQIFMTPEGLQVASCVIIGNCIGERNVPLARRYFRLAALITTVWCFVISIVLVILKQ